MFGIKADVLADQAPRAADPKPQATPIKVPVYTPETADLMAEHRKLSTQMGIPVPNEDRLKTLLASLDIPTYSMVEVSKYMAIKAKAENPFKNGWVWRVASQRDQQAFYDQHTTMVLGNQQTQGAMIYKNGWFHHTTGIYEHTIPLRALRLMAKIKADEDIGKKVVFAISDYATEKDQLPDPFLLAMLSAKQCYVIDFWDEPGFGVEAMLKGVRD